MERGERGPVDALIACSATLQLVSDLIDEDADVDRRVLDLCIGACDRCIDLGVGPVVEPCRRAARCLAYLFPLP